MCHVSNIFIQPYFRPTINLVHSLRIYINFNVDNVLIEFILEI